MASCVLHVGLPKTGTSSIQESLYFGLEDPAFRYVNLGRVNAAPFLEAIFSDRPEEFWRFRMQGLSPARVRSLRTAFEGRLRRALRIARRRGQSPIISSERCWKMPATMLERLRDLLDDEGFAIRVIAYVRPVKSWVESAFQQEVRWGRWPDLEELLAVEPDGGRGLARWSGRLDALARVFGERNMVVRPFVRSALVGGCAVRDFCSTAGITLDQASVRRLNERSGLEAVRLLRAHDRFRTGSPQVPLHRRALLIERLRALDSEPFRFHPCVFAPYADRIAADRASIRDRYGLDLAEDREAADDATSVRDESDLFRFSRRSLDWLADASGSPPIAACEGEAAARAVAAQVDRLQRRPSWRAVCDLVARRARTRLRWLRHGD